MDIPLLWYLVFLGHGFIIEGKNEHSGIKTRSFNTTQPLNMTVSHFYSLPILTIYFYIVYFSIVPPSLSLSFMSPYNITDILLRSTILSETCFVIPRSPPWKSDGRSASQEIPTFYGTRKFITVFTRAGYRSLSWARWIQSTLPYATSLILWSRRSSK
jgi:hypothetical protein